MKHIKFLSLSTIGLLVALLPLNIFVVNAQTELCYQVNFGASPNDILLGSSVVVSGSINTSTSLLLTFGFHELNKNIWEYHTATVSGGVFLLTHTIQTVGCWTVKALYVNVSAAVLSNEAEVVVRNEYIRGGNYKIVQNPDGSFTWSSEAQWVWNGSYWAPYILNTSAKAKDSGDDCLLVRTGYITAEIFKGYPVAKFWDVNYTEVRLYEERWVVEYWKTNQWKDTGVGAQAPSFTYVENSSGVFVTRSQSLTGVGKLDVIYAFLIGAPVKNTVLYTNLGSADVFRITQQWNGIVGGKVAYNTGATKITQATVVNSSYFQFLKSDGSLSILGNQWSMCFTTNQTTGQTIPLQNQCLQPVTVDVSAQGMKSDFTFANWTLAMGQSLTIDPTTSTFSPPTKDSFVTVEYPNTNYGTVAYIEVNAYTGAKSRSFLEFDLSSIQGTVITAKLDLYASYVGAASGRYINISKVTGSWTEDGVTWNNQPAVTNTGSVNVSAPDHLYVGWWNQTVTNMVTLGGAVDFRLTDNSETSSSHQYFRFDSKEGINAPILEVTYEAAPINGALSNADIDGDQYGAATNVFFAQRKWYTATTNCSDADGYADIKIVQFRIKVNSATNRTVFQYYEDTNTFSLVNGSSWELDTSSCSASRSGTLISVTWKFKPRWNATEEANQDIELYVEDAGGLSDTDTVITDYYQTVTRIKHGGWSAGDFQSNATRTNVGGYVNLTGTLCYVNSAGSSIYSSYHPPASEFNFIAIHSGATGTHVEVAKNTTPLNDNGFFQSVFAIPSTVGVNQYHVYADYVDTEASDEDLSGANWDLVTYVYVIGDRLEFESITANDTRIDIGSNFNLTYKIRYDFDNIYLNSNLLSFDGVNDYVSAPALDLLNHSWVMTVNPNYAIASTVLLYDTAGGNNYWVRIDHSGKMFSVYSSRWTSTGYHYSNTAYTSGVTQIGLTWNSTHIQLYVNGTLDNTISNTYVGSGNFFDGNTQICGQYTSESGVYSGIVSNITFYNRALSSSEMSSLYSGTYISSGCACYLPLNGTTNDYSGNGKHGTNYGATFLTASVSGFTWNSANNQWTKTVTGSSSVTSTNYDETYVSVTDSAFGVTTKQDVAGVNVVTDRMVLSAKGVDDSRRDINTQGTAWFTIRSEYDNTYMGSGSSLTINGSISATWSAGNNRWEITRTKSSVQKEAYYPASLNWATYGITALTDASANTTSIIWDRVQLTLSVSDSRINAGDNASISASSIFEFDSTSFAGSYTLNDTATSKSTVGIYGFAVTSITDPTYGLTAFTSNSISMIYDKANIVISVADNRINVNTNASISVTSTHAYDNSVHTGTVTLNDTTFQQATAGRRGYTATAITGGTYGITVLGTITTNYVIWDSVTISLSDPSDQRIDINTNASGIQVSGTYNYDSTPFDGTITLNSTTFQYATAGRHGYQVSSISGGTHGITVMSNSPTTYCVWDSLTINIVVGDNRININTNASISVSATYDYDSSAFDGSFTLNYTTYSHATAQRRGYTVSSVSGGSYGITAISTNDQDYVIWDRISLIITIGDYRIDVGTNASIAVRGTHDYDSAIWHGSPTMNDTTYNYATVGKRGYTVNSVTDSDYGITAFTVTPEYAIFEKLSLTYIANSTSLQAGQTVNINATAIFLSDNSTVPSWSHVNSYRNGSHYALGNFTDYESGNIAYVFTCENASENTYGITAFTSNTIMVTWSGLTVQCFNIYQNATRVNVGSTVTVGFQLQWSSNASQVSSGSLYINGSAKGISSGWVNFTAANSSVCMLTYTETGVSAEGITLYSQTVGNPSVIWDAANIVISVADNRINVEENASVSITATHAYDGSIHTGTVTLNDTTFSQATVGRRGYTANNITGGTYGITTPGSITENYVIWDALNADSCDVDMANSKVYVHIKYGYDGANVAIGNASLADRCATTNSTGWASFDMSTGSDFTWNQTAYGVQDGTYGITYKAQNQSLLIAKATRLIQSDAPVTATWDASGIKLTLSFPTATGASINISGSQPIYLLNNTYDLNTNYTSFLQLTHDGSRDITIGYPNWGDFYIKSLSQGYMTDLGWADQALSLVLNGTGSGTLEVYCGSRGMPKPSGFGATGYDTVTKIFSGTYVFSSPIILELDFNPTSGGITMHETSGGSQISTIFASAEVRLGQISAGQTQFTQINVTWDGVNSITVTQVCFSGDGADWITIYDVLPLILTKDINGVGKGFLAAKLVIPQSAQIGNYTIPVHISANAIGNMLETTSWVNFEVTSPSIWPSDIAQYMTYIFAAIFLIALAYVYLKK